MFVILLIIRRANRYVCISGVASKIMCVLFGRSNEHVAGIKHYSTTLNDF